RPSPRAADELGEGGGTASTRAGCAARGIGNCHTGSGGPGGQAWPPGLSQGAGEASRLDPGYRGSAPGGSQGLEEPDLPLIVSNTTPITNLLRLGLLPALGHLVGEVVVPPEVIAELEAGHGPADGWLPAKDVLSVEVKAA